MIGKFLSVENSRNSQQFSGRPTVPDNIVCLLWPLFSCPQITCPVDSRKKIEELRQRFEMIVCWKEFLGATLHVYWFELLRKCAAKVFVQRRVHWRCIAILHFCAGKKPCQLNDTVASLWHNLCWFLTYLMLIFIRPSKTGRKLCDYPRVCPEHYFFILSRT